MIKLIFIFMILFNVGCAEVEPKKIEEKQPDFHNLSDVDLDVLHNKCVSKGYDEGSEKYNQCMTSKEKDRGKK